MKVFFVATLLASLNASPISVDQYIPDQYIVVFKKDILASKSNTKVNKLINIGNG
jgi:hypothetical protein